MMGYSSVDRRNVFGMTKEADDLASKLIRGLTTRPFLECPICFSDLLPAQAIWSCLPTYSSVSPGSADTTCCYTPFHLSCMQDWSSRSLKEARERARDRTAGEAAPITWRCPGCQKHRESTVTNYQCFCGRIKHLKATEENRGTGSIAVPHSCGQSCSRKRSYCDHPCPLPCHPGPCPPCNISLVIPCASHEHPLAVKCSAVRGGNASAPTCDEVCNRVQDCGHPEHRCLEPCHEGPCQECKVQEQVLCFCGKEEKSVKCGWKKADEVECGVREGDVDRTWRARFGCGNECGRLYDCGEHSCQEVRPISISVNDLILTSCTAMPSSSHRTTTVPPFARVCDALPMHSNTTCRLYVQASTKMHGPHSDVWETLSTTSVRMRTSV
jgi:transcriptional repressor NF-X1